MKEIALNEILKKRSGKDFLAQPELKKLPLLGK